MGREEKSSEKVGRDEKSLESAAIKAIIVAHVSHILFVELLHRSQNWLYLIEFHILTHHFSSDYVKTNFSIYVEKVFFCLVIALFIVFNISLKISLASSHRKPLVSSFFLKGI